MDTWTQMVYSKVHLLIWEGDNNYVCSYVMYMPLHSSYSNFNIDGATLHISRMGMCIYLFTQGRITFATISIVSATNIQQPTASTDAITVINEIINVIINVIIHLNTNHWQ